MQPTHETVAALDRRRFLRTVVLACGTVLLDWPARAEIEADPASCLYRWFPQFPAPRDLWVVPFAGDVEEGMVLESAAGLAALRVLEGKWDTLIYEDVQNDGYQRWFAEYCQAHRPKVTRLGLDEAVAGLQRADIARGYLLFRFEQSTRPLHSPGKLDESANVATSLAAAHNGLAVSERLAGRMEKLGLKRLLDVRERTEQSCLAQGEFSHRVLGTADPKTRNARSLMIALNAFVCSGRGEAYEKGLARCEPDAPVLGWGCEAEDRQTIPSTRWGLFQTATNWCHNLPAFAGDVLGESISANQLRHPHPLHWSALDWGDGIHHVNFTLSDGDNVQWMMCNFTGGSEAPSYYGNPKRGRFPFTWGLPVPSLCQLSPRTLAEIMAKATVNDDFIQFHGGGYFYPDLYGKARGTDKALELHAERLRAYMDLTGIRILAFNFQDWDGPEARAACEMFACKLPGLLGILAYQYNSYPAGQGTIRWVKGAGGDEVPVVSCRLCIWAQIKRPRETTPAAVAAWLNRLPVAREKANDDCFSWVMAHAWSRFRRAEKGAPLDAEEKGVAQDKETPDTARGYDPVLWAVERLEPKVKPVTAQELFLRVRLRLRPQATLARWLVGVKAAVGPEMPPRESVAQVAEARALLPLTGRDASSARRCFELLKSISQKSLSDSAPRRRYA
jgi:hypothetical protein